jgi:hypothetical protein
MPEVLLQGTRILAVVGQPHAVSLEAPEATDRGLRPCSRLWRLRVPHGQVFGGEEHLDAARVEQLNVDQDIAPNLPLNNVQLALPE